MQSKTGDLLANTAISQYAADLTPALAMREDMALSGLKKADEGNYLKTIGLMLLRTMELMNATNSLSTVQIADLTVRLGKKFYYLRLDELVYVFDRAVSGEYGRDFNRIDAGVVMGWIEKYDTGERQWAVDAAREQAHVETPAVPLSDELLTEYYQRVKAGEKTFVIPDQRISEYKSNTAQAEARTRYVQEKAAGIVEDIGWEDVTQETTEQL